jgi:hypothetical protein
LDKPVWPNGKTERVSVLEVELTAWSFFFWQELFDVMAAKAPVLFLAFNRPEPTRQVFQAIRTYCPTHLYVAADGPRPEKPGEWRLCAETRRIVQDVDWDCEVQTLFRDENLGCGAAVNGAISWFFDREEYGIILEDDCLPDPTFFPFAAEMLERFRDEPRVGSISGDNFLPRSLSLNQPYGFSKYVQIWGWATWRRFWERYDFELSGDEAEWESIIRRVNPIENQAKYWLQIFQALRSGLIDTWDYQVMFSAWKADLVHIFPSRNLISNLGYGTDATHTNFQSPLASLRRESINNYEITLPVKVDPQIDEATFYFRFLESLSNVWWLEQAMDATKLLAWSRWHISQAQAEISRSRSTQQEQTRETSKMLAARHRTLFRVRWILLLGHFVYTCRYALTLLRSKGNQLLNRSLLKRVAKPELQSEPGPASHPGKKDGSPSAVEPGSRQSEPIERSVR